MSLQLAIDQMKSLLLDLKNIDFGYPLGENSVRTPLPAGEVIAALSATGECGVTWLRELYSACDGLHLPDVHVGYFIKPLDQVGLHNRSSEPDTVQLDREIQVLPIGSTGGGDLFVVDCQFGNVMLLPPGPLLAGRYDGRAVNVKQVANSVADLVRLILGDLRAIVVDDQKHVYLTA